MKLLWSSLPFFLCIASLAQAKDAALQWNGLKLAQNNKKRRHLGGVRGEKKDPEEYDSPSGKEGKKKLAHKDKCNRDRRSVTVSTVFDGALVSPVTTAGSNLLGVEFEFGGDYSGVWTQTSIEITEEIVIGHDQLTFFDADGETVGALSTQFDGTLDFAIITAGYGAFACAQGSPTIVTDEASTMVNVIWDLCVCYK